MGLVHIIDDVDLRLTFLLLLLYFVEIEARRLLLYSCVFLNFRFALNVAERHLEHLFRLLVDVARPVRWYRVEIETVLSW